MASSVASAAQDSSRQWMPAAAAGMKERSSLPHSLKGSEQEESPVVARAPPPRGGGRVSRSSASCSWGARCHAG